MVTDFSFGFDTAVNIVMEAVDRLRTTTESHRRIVVVETMGRHSGWIACFAGLAVGADYILVPEVPIDLPHLVSVLSKRRAAGKKYGIVIVAEGARFPDRAAFTLDDHHPDPFGNPRLGGIGHVIAEAIHKHTGIETRTAVLGHLQRGGAPSAYDRISGHPAGFGCQPVGSPETLRHHGHAHGWTDRRHPDERERRGDKNTRPHILRRGRSVLLLTIAKRGPGSSTSVRGTLAHAARPIMPVPVTRLPLQLNPDPRRVISRLFCPGDMKRSREFSPGSRRFPKRKWKNCWPASSRIFASQHADLRRCIRRPL